MAQIAATPNDEFLSDLLKASEHILYRIDLVRGGYDYISAAGLLEPDPLSPDDRVRAALGLRPVTLPGGAAQWLISDLDGLMRPHPQHRRGLAGAG